MGREFTRKKDGDLVEPRDLNWLYEHYSRFRQTRGANLAINQANGSSDPEIGLFYTPTMHARLTGPFDAVLLGYPWEEVTVGAGRAVATTGLVGSPAAGSPAFERRIGDTTLTADGTVYLFRRSPASAQWVFPHRNSTGSGPPVSIPGCPCALSPATINMVSSKPASNNQIFQSATLQYGPTPSSLLPVVLTPSSYLSTSSFPDPILNASFYYFLTCSLGAYVLTRVYVTSPFGSPFRDSIRYKWVPGFPGNICTPFSMTNGQIFTGGDASCVVTLSV